MNYESTLREANRIYKIFNDEFYSGELPDKEIYIGKEKREGCINIKPDEYFPRLLLEEMAHLYCKLHNIQDTSRQGRYFNAEFKHVAESHGLECSFEKNVGWRFTALTTRAIDVLTLNDFRDELFRGFPTEVNKQPKPSFVQLCCPVCGQKIRGTANVKVICANPECESVINNTPQLFEVSTVDGRSVLGRKKGTMKDNTFKK